MSKRIEIKRNGIFVLVDINRGERVTLYTANDLNQIKKYLDNKGVIN